MHSGFKYSLHDAEIESISLGPRREVRLTLLLGSARISDPRLPDSAILRLGAIENFDQVREFFARFEPERIGRIDCVALVAESDTSATLALEIDPLGTVQVVCSKIELMPNPAT